MPYIDKNELLNGIYSDNPTDVMLYIARFPTADVVGQSVVDQIRWERDTAIAQLAEIGKGFGETMDDVVERKRGKWLKSEESITRPYMCSNCGCLYDVDTIMGKLCWRFCPNCGARMDKKGGADEETR